VSANCLPFALIAGFGLPGRAVAEALGAKKIEFTVIEANAEVVQRCAATGVPIVNGDVRDVAILKQAGIDRATLVALCVPIDSVIAEAVSIIRSLNARAHIIARCAMTSTGFEARQRGANEIIVAEQVVAQEFVKMLAAYKIPPQ
jgi:voltage-gated potassium channel Kch